MLKVKHFFIILLLLSGNFTQALAEDKSQLLTLFSTAQERQIINNNRYKNDTPVKNTPVQPQSVEEVVELPKVEVNMTYQISGVSTNTEGSKTAWVNGKSYESGDVMEDGSKIRIRNTTVIITTVDGKSHTGVSGEVLELTYLRAAEQ